MIDILLFIAFLGLLYGSYTDIKTREVPDWVSYSLIISGLGLRALYSAINLDWAFLISGLIGFGIFFALAWILFYTGQWGGGDAKVLMGLGALIGFELTPFTFLISFFINLLLVGALYGIIWSIYLAIKNKNKFSKEFRKLSNKIKRIKMIMFVLVFLIIILSFFASDLSTRILSLILAILIYLGYYAYVFMKTVENSSMYKMYDIKRLTEGDWIVKVIKHKGKYICGPKDLGITKEQIKLLKKYKIKQVLVKEGIPFIPPKLIAFIVTYFWGNILFLIF